MPVYFNENDPFAAAWLRELVKAGVLPDGEVDERDIRDVRAGDIAEFRQCHWFAGIGGWAYALQIAGWPDDRPVWTGSCPCQPFSQAGQGAGVDDERHLWPSWFWLVEQCRPAVVFGEQVASPAALGWWDLVSTDLEGAGYAVGAADLCAAGVGAPHIRQRMYWVANTPSSRRREERADGARGAGGDSTQGIAAGSGAGCSDQWPNADHCFWRSADWLGCRDGRWRPVEPGTFPLASGLPARVGRLRGYGNSIVPPLAAEFIKAFTSSES